MAVVLIGAGLVTTSATASQALTWNSSNSPLTVTAYGSTGKGYGTWTVSTGTDGTRSRLTANLSYSNGDNHKVFAQLQTWTNSTLCAAPQYTSCSVAFTKYAQADTAAVNVPKTTYTAKSITTGLPGSASTARAGILVKLSIPLRNDAESSISWTDGLKY